LNEKIFIEYWINKIQSEGLKKFPLHFIDESLLEIFSIPIKTLVLGQEFFGAYEIITTNGEQVYQASTLEEAKFFIYSSKERNGKAYLPNNRALIKSNLEAYNAYLDSMLEEIKKDYRKNISDGKNLLAVSNEIFQKLNLIRL
jgi:hypothetical protein